MPAAAFNRGLVVAACDFGYYEVDDDNHVRADDEAAVPGAKAVVEGNIGVFDNQGQVQDGVAAKAWPELVELVRTGPPFYNPMSLGPLNEAANSVEYFVHHEDVRRGRPGPGRRR